MGVEEVIGTVLLVVAIDEVTGSELLTISDVELMVVDVVVDLVLVLVLVLMAVPATCRFGKMPSGMTQALFVVLKKKDHMAGIPRRAAAYPKRVLFDRCTYRVCSI